MFSCAYRSLMNTPRRISRSIAAAALLATGFFVGFYSRTPPTKPIGAGSVPAHPGRTGQASVASKLSAISTTHETATRAAVATDVARANLAHLTGLTVTPQDPRSIRALLHEFEKLREAGAVAVPAIREFLATGRDTDYNAVGGKGFRNGIIPLDFTVPPSLRLGLLEVLKNIGGSEAEAALVHELQTTGRGVEAAYLGAVLQQLAPEKYNGIALTAARDLLAMPLTSGAQNPIDRSDREYLYSMLATAGDLSQTQQAQSQLLLPNGQIDQGALRYLRQVLGERVLRIASAAWQDPRVDAKQREPLARLALEFVGKNESAEELYRAAINDPALSAGARKNLIEDLNQTGFADPKHPTLADLPLVQKRLALIEQLAPLAGDRTNAAALVEARKDLLNMRDKLLSPATRPK
jgi:hypothetical protein